MSASCYAATHQGLRKYNEDAFLNRPDLGLWVVADGMGGCDAGDLASGLIVRELGHIGATADGGQLLAEVRARLEAVNRTLIGEAAKLGPGRTVGSTVVALMIAEGHYACLWAGDSRLYRLRNGRIDRLTRDHSHVQDLVDAAVISADMAEKHPLANVVTRAVGVTEPLDLDKATSDVLPGDLFLLCTDGVCKALDDAAIQDILQARPPADIPNALIAAALDAGGSDNITVVAVLQ